MKGLTISMIFDAMSANFGEGIGNISELKKLTKNNQEYTYISRQAIRYDVFRMINEKEKIEAPLTNKGTNQFDAKANAKDHIEVDLFGYMKTTKGQGSATRPAAVRFSHAVSLEAYKGDIEFAANHNFAGRAKANPNPFNLETHSSLYTYTVTIDLDRIGKEDSDEKSSLNAKERARRVSLVLDTLRSLNREIKARVENFNPLFAIGGVYDIKNPYFLGRIALDGKNKINTKILKSTIENIDEKTRFALVDGFFNNDFEKELGKSSSIKEFFNTLKKEVEDYYKGE